MDLTPIIVGVAAVNVGVFLAGCALAAYRTWRDLQSRARRRRVRPKTLTAVAEAAGASNESPSPWGRR